MRKKARKRFQPNKNTEKSIELECIPLLHIMQSRCYWNNAPAVKNAARNMEVHAACAFATTTSQSGIDKNWL